MKNRPVTKILVVENKYIVALAIKNNLENLGYEAFVIISPDREAIQKVIEINPHLVLMDIMVAREIDSAEFAAQIRLRLDIPLIYLTTCASLPRVKITGSCGYLHKPFTQTELQATIEIVLYRRKLDQESKKNQSWPTVILKEVVNAVIATDVQGCVNFMNSWAEDLTGWRLAEALGKNLTELFNIVDRETHTLIKNPAAKVIREGVILDLVNYDLIARCGVEIPITGTVVPTKNNTKNITGAILIFCDIVRYKQMGKDMALYSCPASA